ncbi:MAG TPA: prephenate dehydrogenase/arogenate dehydrogenase family protein [Spirochaetia bacterium]|nr:prephenate dehydrogenase/arogenate dehydrogenase family protein [Spirochaetia bacterium]
MTIGVYGLGRFGYFWAEVLARHASVCGYSRDAARRVPRGVRKVGEEELLSLPGIFLCVAISAMEEVVSRISRRLSAGALVMDTCSVKTYPVAVMQRLLPDGVSILGTHPMFGPDSARNGVAGLPMILCPARIPRSEVERWREFFVSLGLSVSFMSPDDHDREAAYTQGVTHYIGRVLSDFGVSRSPIGTVGFAKLLEIVEQTCNDPWQLFLDLQRYNPHTREMRSKLAKSLAAVMDAIDESLERGDPPVTRLP